jgi:hypothetical protein
MTIVGKADPQTGAAREGVTEGAPAAPGARSGAPLPTLPEVPTGADLAPLRLAPGWPVACFAIAFLLYLALLPHFLLYSSPPTGDQPYYLMDIASLVQDGDLNVKNNYDQHDDEKFYSLAPHPPGFVGMSAPHPVPRQLADTPARPSTEEYGAHLPGLAVLLAPAWLAGSFVDLWWPATICVLCAMGALLAANALLLAYEVTGRRGIALAVWAAVAFSNPIMTYSYLVFTELPTGLLLIYALRRLARGWAANGPLRLVLIGACIGYIPWLAWRCVLIAVPLGLYAALQWWRYRQLPPAAGAPPGAHPLRRGILAAGWLAAPIGLSIGLLVAFNLFRFGTLLQTGASQARGQTEVFYWPWAGRDDLVHFLDNGFGLLFDVQWGLLIYAPIYLLAVIGGIAMWRSARPADRRLLLVLLACATPYWFVITAYLGWNGVWCPPARYQATFVALAAAPLALALWAGRGWFFRPLFALLAAWGWVAMAIMMRDPIGMWPFGDGRTFTGAVFDWFARAPQAPLHFDLRPILPSFLTPDEVRHPATTGGLIAVAFLVVLAGTLLLARPSARRLRPAPLLAWTGAALLVGLGWWVINADYLKPKTLLVEQHRWVLPHPLPEAHGIAYLAGKIFIASLGPRSARGELQPGAGELGALDLETGAYARVPLIGATGVLTYALPGDVKAGSAGSLYLLNNGPGTQALYVLQPDGHVIRQMALDGKGRLALGLAFGPQGDLYTSDMGAVHPFPPDGGKAHATWGGLTASFNNVMGVAVAPDGRIFAAESSMKRVQVLDGTGQFQQALDMRCGPEQAVLQGDWIDVICDAGLRSINWQTLDVRVAQLGAGATPLQSPTALTYSPDGTLYILDSAALVGYRVQR